MSRTVIVMVVLVLGTLLGATVFREQVAQAARAILPVTVMNTPAEAVPVTQQGTVDVNVTNNKAVTGGGGAVGMSGDSNYVPPTPVTATALSIRMSATTGFVNFLSGGDTVALFSGPFNGGNTSIVLALTRPIMFDEVRCEGAEGRFCSISWVGAEP